MQANIRKPVEPPAELVVLKRYPESGDKLQIRQQISFKLIYYTYYTQCTTLLLPFTLSKSTMPTTRCRRQLAKPFCIHQSHTRIIVSQINNSTKVMQLR